MKLLERLDELDIARKAMAEAAGVTERTVYRWLSYQMEPRLTLIQVANLCDLLKWSAKELAEAYYPAGGEPSVAAESPGNLSPK